jgi:hypothetical protein
MRPEDFVNLVPVGHVNFQVELRLLITQFFPRLANLPRLLFGLLLGRIVRPQMVLDCSGRGRAQNAVPQIIRRNHRQADRFPAFSAIDNACVNKRCSMLPNN